MTSDGGYLIADRTNNRVREVVATGNVITVAGAGAPGFVGDGGPAPAAQLTSPARSRCAPTAAS